MEILLDVVVAGLVAGGVAGGIVLMGRSRGPRHAAAGAGALPIAPRRRGSQRAGEAGAPALQDDGASLEGAGVHAGSAMASPEPEAGGGGRGAGVRAGAGTPGGGARAVAGTPGGGARAGATLAVATDSAAQAAVRADVEGELRERRVEIDSELRERRAEIARIEERMLTKEEALEVRLEENARRERSLEDRARNLDAEAEKLKASKREQLRELERVAGLTSSQARQILLKELEEELRHDSAKLVHQIEEEARREADRRARSILATCMQRLAGTQASETTVSVVSLQSDDLKGRIIGREGRNIRALEMLTGIDFIVDDTPGAVILSGFDGVRREIARLTLEKLLQDGRIHPARIEEAYYESRSAIENRIVEVGEQAVLEANVGTLHPELTKLLGRLHYRTSYGQNVLAHSVECAHLASMLSAELGASNRTAARAALLHDIGKAVTHEIEGPHALVGGELARRYNEAEAVAHAMEAHHNEVAVRTIEAVIVQIADSISGARPGARGESLEHYTKRLRELEEIARRHEGVEKVYAMQAGREIRVIVQPDQVDDDTAALLSHRIARDLERELEYAGQIKVTVIRESRAVDYAK